FSTSFSLFRNREHQLTPPLLNRASSTRCLIQINPPLTRAQHCCNTVPLLSGGDCLSKAFSAGCGRTRFRIRAAPQIPPAETGLAPSPRKIRRPFRDCRVFQSNALRECARLSFWPWNLWRRQTNRVVPI